MDSHFSEDRLEGKSIEKWNSTAQIIHIHLVCHLIFKKRLFQKQALCSDGCASKWSVQWDCEVCWWLDQGMPVQQLFHQNVMIFVLTDRQTYLLLKTYYESIGFISTHCIYIAIRFLHDMQGKKTKLSHALKVRAQRLHLEKDFKRIAKQVWNMEYIVK